MLRPLLSTWYACAQQLGDVELSVRLLVEMLGHGRLVFAAILYQANGSCGLGVGGSEDPGTLEEDLLAVLKVRATACYSLMLIDHR